MEGQIKESLPTAGKNKWSKGLFPVFHTLPLSLSLFIQPVSARRSQKLSSSPSCPHSLKGSLSRRPPPSLRVRPFHWHQTMPVDSWQEHINDQGNRGISLQQPPFIKLGKQSVHLPAQRGASGPFTRRRGGGTKYEKTEKEHQHAGMCFLILCDVRRLLTFLKKSQMTAVF